MKIAPPTHFEKLTVDIRCPKDQQRVIDGINHLLEGFEDYSITLTSPDPDTAPDIARLKRGTRRQPLETR